MLHINHSTSRFDKKTNLFFSPTVEWWRRLFSWWSKISTRKSFYFTVIHNRKENKALEHSSSQLSNSQHENGLYPFHPNVFDSDFREEKFQLKEYSFPLNKFSDLNIELDHQTEWLNDSTLIFSKLMWNEICLKKYDLSNVTNIDSNWKTEWSTLIFSSVKVIRSKERKQRKEDSIPQRKVEFH